jgi:hypothetical protein
MCHINSHTILGKIMLRNINWLQLQTGISTSIFNTDEDISYIDRTWFHSIKEFLNDINATISIHNAWKPTLLRNKDINIMDEALKCGLSKDNLRTFNNWRMYFQVLTLSQITNLDGTHIIETYLQKKHVLNHKSNSSLRWPVQRQPCINKFGIWRSTIQKICKCSSHGILKIPLGKWIINPLHQMKIGSVISTDYKFLFVKQANNRWTRYEKCNSLRNQHYFSIKHCGEYDLDNDSTYQAVDSKQTGNQLLVNTRKSHCIPKYLGTKEVHKTQTISNNISFNIETWETELVKNIKVLNEEILLNPENSSYLVCSDGGLKNGKGSYGLVIQNKSTIALENYGRLPEISGDISSHRCEAFGVLSGIIILHHLLIWQKENSNHMTTTIRTTFICDNKAVIESLTN